MKGAFQGAEHTEDEPEIKNAINLLERGGQTVFVIPFTVSLRSYFSLMACVYSEEFHIFFPHETQGSKEYIVLLSCKLMGGTKAAPWQDPAGKGRIQVCFFCLF